MAKQNTRATIQMIAKLVPEQWRNVDAIVRGEVSAHCIRDTDPGEDRVEEDGDLGFTAQDPSNPTMKLMWCLQQKEPKAATWTGIRIVLSWGSQVFASCTIETDLQETRRGIYGPGYTSADEEAPALPESLTFSSVQDMAECFQNRKPPAWLKARWEANEHLH